jgi:hypothetical protein
MTASPPEQPPSTPPIDAPTGRLFNGPRCHARAVSTGERCGNPAIPGGTVCKYHGGASPQVRAKAQLRLVELIDPAIATLAREMTTAKNSSDRQRAANSLLDRAGVPRRTEVDHGAARTLLADRIQEVLARRMGEVTTDEPAELEDPNVVDADVVPDERMEA